MGEENVKANIFIVDENSEAIELSKNFIDFGVSVEKYYTNAARGEISIDLESKTISRKRFIKLLMGEGYQRNDAIKVHNYYMEKYGTRNKFMVNMFLGGML